MTPEEMNRKVEFLIDYQAEFAIRQDRDHEMFVRDHEMLVRGFETLRESMAGFQTFATQLISMHADRLHRQDQLLESASRHQTETEAFQRQALHLLNLILDRLPPASAHEAL